MKLVWIILLSDTLCYESTVECQRSFGYVEWAWMLSYDEFKRFLPDWQEMPYFVCVNRIGLVEASCRCHSITHRPVKVTEIEVIRWNVVRTHPQISIGKVMYHFFMSSFSARSIPHPIQFHSFIFHYNIVLKGRYREKHVILRVVLWIIQKRRQFWVKTLSFQTNLFSVFLAKLITKSSIMNKKHSCFCIG